MTKEEVKHAVNILVQEYCIPDRIEKNQLYMLHYCIPDEDGMVGASRTSIHLFKTLESVVTFLFGECGIDNYDDLRNNFQKLNAEDPDVWDIIIVEVEK